MLYVASIGTPAALQNLVLYKLVVWKVITAILINWRAFITISLEKPAFSSTSMLLGCCGRAVCLWCYVIVFRVGKYRCVV